jgi:hypothetical protein
MQIITLGTAAHHENRQDHTNPLVSRPKYRRLSLLRSVLWGTLVDGFIRDEKAASVLNERAELACVQHNSSMYRFLRTIHK